MKYRAILTIDFTNQNPAEYQRLIAALLQNGWLYLETSALAIETDDLAAIWAAFALIPRQANDAGSLSALTIQIQGSEDFKTGKGYAAAKNFNSATPEIMQKKFPQPPPYRTVEEWRVARA